MATIERSSWRERLLEGLVIPAMPLALHDNGDWSRPHQRALIRYYIDSGAGGLAVGVHSTQFAIRNPSHDLFRPVLRFASEIMDEFASDDFVRIAGICGRRQQARAEADFAIESGYHAGLLSLAALGDRPEAELIDHVRVISKMIPIIGFYLQPAVGGRVLSYSFWKAFCEIDHVAAIKIAPFDRYLTWDVIRAVIESGRNEIALYTGNDDNIINDLLTPFRWNGQTRFFAGGLLGQWGVWTRRAVEMLSEIQQARTQKNISLDWLSRNAALTDANAAIFDAANGFAGCIPGILEVLRRQGLVPSIRCLDRQEVLSEGQADEISRVCDAYPELGDDPFVARHFNRWLNGQ